MRGTGEKKSLENKMASNHPALLQCRNTFLFPSALSSFSHYFLPLFFNYRAKLKDEQVPVSSKSCGDIVFFSLNIQWDDNLQQKLWLCDHRLAAALHSQKATYWTIDCSSLYNNIPLNYHRRLPYFKQEYLNWRRLVNSLKLSQCLPPGR